MPTMSTETDPSGNTRYVLYDDISLSWSSGINYRNITFGTSSFNRCTKDIKYVCRFTSNLAELNGNNIPSGTSTVLLNTRAGWWFPSTADYSSTNPPEITQDGLTYTIQPYSSGYSGLILKPGVVSSVDHGNHTSSNIQIKIPLTFYNIDRTGATSLSQVKVTPGWIPRGRAIIQSTTQSSGKTSNYQYRTWTFTPHPSIENAYVNVCAYCNNNSTSTKQLGNTTYPDRATVDTVSYVTRYGTGSPGSPYSYSGSRSIRLQYMLSSASTWSYTSATSGISGVTGYNATDYLSFWRVGNYYLPELDVDLP